MEFVVFFLVFIYLFVVQLSSAVKLIYLLLPSISRFSLRNNFLKLFLCHVCNCKSKTKPKRGGEIPNETMSYYFCSQHITSKGCAFRGCILVNSLSFLFSLCEIRNPQFLRVLACVCRWIELDSRGCYYLYLLCLLRLS